MVRALEPKELVRGWDSMMWFSLRCHSSGGAKEHAHTDCMGLNRGHKPGKVSWATIGYYGMNPPQVHWVKSVACCCVLQIRREIFPLSLSFLKWRVDWRLAICLVSSAIIICALVSLVWFQVRLGNFVKKKIARPFSHKWNVKIKLKRL